MHKAGSPAPHAPLPISADTKLTRWSRPGGGRPEEPPVPPSQRRGPRGAGPSSACCSPAAPHPHPPWPQQLLLSFSPPSLSNSPPARPARPLATRGLLAPSPPALGRPRVSHQRRRPPARPCRHHDRSGRVPAVSPSPLRVPAVSPRSGGGRGALTVRALKMAPRLQRKGAVPRPPLTAGPWRGCPRRA